MLRKMHILLKDNYIYAKKNEEIFKKDVLLQIERIIQDIRILLTIKSISYLWQFFSIRKRDLH